MKSIIYICVVISLWLSIPATGLTPATAMASRAEITQNDRLPEKSRSIQIIAKQDVMIEAVAIFGLLIGYCVVAVSLRSRNPTLRAN
jgi:Mg2+/Co2+ transporter CorB